MKQLTKYPFMQGTQCEKSLWLNMFGDPKLKSDPSEEDEAVMRAGKEIGILARELFAGGIDVSDDEKIYGSRLISATKEVMKTDNVIFYEPAFESLDKKMNFRADIFLRTDKNTRLIEVKSATHIKDEYILDLAFQYYVLRNSDYSGPKVQVYLAYLNNEYIRGDELDVQQLFNVENVTQRVKDAQVLIRNYLHRLQPVLQEDSKCPTVKLSRACTEPYQCAFYAHCWEKMPETTILNISRINKDKAYELIDKGVIEPQQLTESDGLSENQLIEVEAYKSGAPRIKAEELRKFMNRLGLVGKTMWMDFESYMPAVPAFPGTHSYQQICIQSCVIKRDSDGTLTRHDFLAEKGPDPRKEFLLNLLKHTEGNENIVVFNERFEIGRLNELAKEYPEYEPEIEQRVSRIVDLMVPFAKKHYYHPAMKGSASLKAVLPCFVDPNELSYKNLVIQNGSQAMNAYLQFENLTLEAQIQTRRALIAYCHLDVLGMVKIAEGLMQLISP